MDRPFRELHELYRILFLRAEAQAKKDKEEAEKKEREQKEEEQKNRPKGISQPMYYKPDRQRLLWKLRRLKMRLKSLLKED